MTDRFALHYAETILVGERRASRTRASRRSRPRRTSSRSSRRARGCGRSAGATRGSVPSTRRRRRRFSVSPREAPTTASAAAPAATRSRSCGRRKDSTSSARSNGSPTASTSARVRGGVAAGRRAAAAPRAPLALLEQAASYYERVLWESAEGASRASTSRRGTSARRFAASSGSGSRPGAGRWRRRRARRASRPSSPRPGWSRPRQRRLPGPADVPARRRPRARARVPGAEAARGRSAARQVRQLARGRALPQVELLYGLHLARARSRSRTARSSSRGNTDVIALRQAGLEPVVASMGTALTERQLKELARLTKRVFLCFDADAAGEDATLRGMELALEQGLDVRVVALPTGTDPADDPSAFEPRLPEASRTRSIASGSSSSAHATRARRTCASRSVLDASGLARAPGGLAARERSPRDDRAAARGRVLDDVHGPAGDDEARRGGGAARAQRARGRPCAPESNQDARRDRVRSLRVRSPPACRGRAGWTHGAGADAVSWPSSMRSPRQRRSTSRRPSSCCCG